MAGDNWVAFAPIAGKTSQSTTIRLISSAGADVTGKLATNLTAYYYRQGASATTSISLSDLANLNSAYTSGGVKEIGNGLYRLDLPDAMLATGVDWVDLVVTCSGAITYPERMTLSDAVPGVAAGASGGIPIVGTGTNNFKSDSSANVTAADVKAINAIAATSVTTINANVGTTQPINFTSTAGNALVKSDLIDIVSAAVDTTLAQLGVNVVKMNAVNASSITTINANQGTTQPINFTGTGASALTKSDLIDIVGAAVNTALAQLGVNVVSQANIDFGALQKASLNAATPSVTVSDKTGFSLSAAGILAIWHQLTSAIVTVGSIGKLLVDNIDATISSRLATSGYTAPDNTDIVTILTRTDVATSTRLASASYTAPDNVDIAAIKTKTDQLTFTVPLHVDATASSSDPWSVAIPDGYAAGEAGFILGNLSAAVFPAGAIEVTFTVLNSVTSQPIDGARVWISTDVAGTNTIWAGTTNAFGIAINVNNEKPFLNAGTYYAWIQDSGYTDTNPTTLVVS